MKIIDLPKPIYAKICEHIANCKLVFNNSGEIIYFLSDIATLELIDSFNWLYSPEGSIIWSDVNQGNYKSFHKFHGINQYNEVQSTTPSDEGRNSRTGIRVSNTRKPTLVRWNNIRNSARNRKKRAVPTQGKE